MTMPPAPKPIQASELAKAGTDRRPPVSAAIGLSATTVIHGAPNDSARITSTTVATIQDDLVSMDCTMIVRACLAPFLSAARCRPRRQQEESPAATSILRGARAGIRG